MPISISEYTGVDFHIFAKTGAFDAILDVDSKLFIDPHLLQHTKAPELRESYARISTRFSTILHLLSASKGKDDPFWREALRRFHFPELRGLCIGYASKSTAGSGMGIALRTKILATAKQIVDAGITDPELFELVGLFEEGIGSDRISDMVGRIIIDDLRQYTHRVFAELGVETKSIQDTSYRSVANPYGHYFVILLPKDILRDLPIAKDWSEIDTVCAHNQELRNRINQLIGKTWKTATNGSKPKLRSVLLKEPEVLRDLIEQYRKKPATTYDYDIDRAGQVNWLPAARKYSKDFPLALFLSANPTPEEILKTVQVICEKFRDLVENNGLSSLLYETANKPKKEEAAQKVFYGIADSYCAANNLDLSGEVNSGRGPVDFKISKGYKGRVLVEIKLTTNQQLLHGFETQLIEYQKAEKTESSIYLVINVEGGSATRIESLKKLIATKKEAGQRVPEVIFVDALPKKSASKF